MFYKIEITPLTREGDFKIDQEFVGNRVLVEADKEGTYTLKIFKFRSKNIDVLKMKIPLMLAVGMINEYLSFLEKDYERNLDCIRSHRISSEQGEWNDD